MTDHRRHLIALAWTATARVIVHEILEERKRQFTDLRWTPQCDDGHSTGFIAHLALAKLAFVGGVAQIPAETLGHLEACGCAPDSLYNGTPRQLLVEAAALIVAEIERIDRAAAKAARNSAE